MADPRLPRARGPHCLRHRAFAGDAMSGPFKPAPSQVSRSRGASEGHDNLGKTAWSARHGPRWAFPILAPRAHQLQFLDRDNRAHRGKAKINSRLCSIGGLNRIIGDLPSPLLDNSTLTTVCASSVFNRDNRKLPAPGRGAHLRTCVAAEQMMDRLRLRD
jgi:hypothetical protein